VQVCCQVHTTSLELGTTLVALWDMHVILGWITYEVDNMLN
jgi:hypothetical protein